MRAIRCCISAALLVACGSSSRATNDPSAAGTSVAGAAADAPPFDHPEPPPYLSQPGKCGFDAPAFCDDFEQGPAPSSRSGELDAQRWSVARGMPQNAAYEDDVLRIGPARIGQCRADLSNTVVLPDSDVLVCDPIPTIPTRHVLATAAAQNYGLSTYRIRQPFDFAGRTARSSSTWI